MVELTIFVILLNLQTLALILFLKSKIWVQKEHIVLSIVLMLFVSIISITLTDLIRPFIDEGLAKVLFVFFAIFAVMETIYLLHTIRCNYRR